jgi:dienelactone hydrolase
MSQKLSEAGIQNELIVIHGGGHGFEDGPGEDDPQVQKAWKQVLGFLSNHV